mmetsp:Transcript_34361/g.84264  ORF Transcript_34361/g.84264 Transcript_34361/m.84264 type:complete len:264 (-) Transcript_34361:481-1272(-)
MAAALLVPSYTTLSGTGIAVELEQHHARAERKVHAARTELPAHSLTVVLVVGGELVAPRKHLARTESQNAVLFYRGDWCIKEKKITMNPTTTATATASTTSTTATTTATTIGIIAFALLPELDQPPFLELQQEQLAQLLTGSIVWNVRCERRGIVLHEFEATSLNAGLEVEIELDAAARLEAGKRLGRVQTAGTAVRLALPCIKFLRRRLLDIEVPLLPAAVQEMEQLLAAAVAHERTAGVVRKVVVGRRQTAQLASVGPLVA